jgi:hypothetical protein
MKMEQTEGSETLAIKLHKAENNQKENISQEYAKSPKSQVSKLSGVKGDLIEIP